MRSGLSIHAPWLMLLGAFAPAADAQENEEGSSLGVSASYTGDLRRNTTGGLAVGTAYSDAVDLGLVWVSDGLFPGTRMTTNLSVMHLAGKGFSEHYLGDLQGANNIEGPQGWKLYESWMEFSFGSGGNTLRAGVLDLNAEFDTPVTQGIFTSSPFGIGTDLSQTGNNGPVCWPTTGLGVRVAGNVGVVLWRFGAFDGSPGANEDSFTSTQVSSDEGALLAGELEYSSDRIHKLGIGAWSYTAAFERLDAPHTGNTREQHGNHGFYAHLDTRLGSAGAVDFDGAVRAGVAEARFNAVDRYVGAAVTASHLIPARPGDALGFGVAWAHLGDDYIQSRFFSGQPATAAETTFELVYRAELTPWLSLLPNVQYIREPGADASLGNAWVAGLRFELSRERSWPLNARRQPTTDESYARSE
jgi:porin